MAKNNPTEDVEQRLLAQYLDSTDLLWCHVPNGGKRHFAVARKLKQFGVKSGCPDVLVFSKPKNKQYNQHAGLAIELKRVDGGYPTRNQKKWLEGLYRQSWVTAVCHGHKAAIELINEVYGLYR